MWRSALHRSLGCRAPSGKTRAGLSLHSGIGGTLAAQQTGKRAGQAGPAPGLSGLRGNPLVSRQSRGSCKRKHPGRRGDGETTVCTPGAGTLVPETRVQPKPLRTGPPESGQCRQTAVSALSLTNPKRCLDLERLRSEHTTQEADLTSLHTPPAPTLPHSPGCGPGDPRGSPHTPPFGCSLQRAPRSPCRSASGRLEGRRRPSSPPGLRAPGPRAPTAAAPSRPRGPGPAGSPARQPAPRSPLTSPGAFSARFRTNWAMAPRRTLGARAAG